MKATVVPAPAPGEGGAGDVADGGGSAGDGATGADGTGEAGDSAAEAGLGSGPPPIVSLDEMARAESAEKKRQRKAKPAGKKVGWADRAGRTLQVRMRARMRMRMRTKTRVLVSARGLSCNMGNSCCVE